MQGYKNLAMGILQQAIEDYKMLKENGIITNDNNVLSNEDWPKVYNKKGEPSNQKFCGISKPYEVLELVRWLSESVGKISAAEILSATGMNFSQDEMCKSIGLK